MFWRFHARSLLRMPEPAAPNGNIALRRQPFGAMLRAGGRFLLAHIARRCGSPIRRHRIVGRPARIARNSAFVSHPANVGTDIAEDHGFGLKFADQRPGIRPVVVGPLIDGAFFARTTVKTVATVRAIVPDFENRSVVGQKLCQLPPVDIDISRRAIGSIVTIPRRKINAEPEIAPPSRRRDIAYHVALATTPGGRLDRPLSGSGWPEAKTVMMFARQNHAAHVGADERIDNGIGVKFRGLKKIRVFIAVAPLFIGESIDREMQKSRGFQLVPGELAG